MHCPTCRSRTLVAIEDLRGASGGHCPECRGRWCATDEAVTLGVFTHADVRSVAVPIAACPTCARHSLAPVDAVRTVPTRPLHCADCDRVWIAGITLDVIRGVSSHGAAARGNTTTAGDEDVSHSLWARIKATYGVDADDDDDRYETLAAQDSERQPLALALAVPIVALLVWVLDAFGLLRFLLQSTLIMGFHEAGHAIAAWLTGRVAVPLPFLTLSTDESGPFAFLLSAAVLATMLWLGVRRRLPFWIGLALLGVWLLMSKGFASDPQQWQWISAAGVGGEFVLGTLCIVAFFHRVYRRPSWDLMRYAVLLAGMAVFLPSWSRWRRISAGDEPFPLGSLVYGDSDGDMNRLLVAGRSQQSIVESYLSLGQLCIAVIVGYWLWTLWRAYVARSQMR
jgi:hypothetical protein